MFRSELETRLQENKQIQEAKLTANQLNSLIESAYFCASPLIQRYHSSMFTKPRMVEVLENYVLRELHNYRTSHAPTNLLSPTKLNDSPKNSEPNTPSFSCKF